jgi:hypothetical protein
MPVNGGDFQFIRRTVRKAKYLYCLRWLETSPSLVGAASHSVRARFTLTLIIIHAVDTSALYPC